MSDSLESVDWAALRLAHDERLDRRSIDIVRIGAKFHDTGFLWSYNINEPAGGECAARWMTDSDFEFTGRDIVEVGLAIGATNRKEEPRGPVEAVLLDADVATIGLFSFFAWNERLRVESARFPESPMHEASKDRARWDIEQIAFLEKHEWHTEAAHTLLEPTKAENLKVLREFGTAVMLGIEE